MGPSLATRFLGSFPVLFPCLNPLYQEPFYHCFTQYQIQTSLVIVCQGTLASWQVKLGNQVGRLLVPTGLGLYRSA